MTWRYTLLLLGALFTSSCGDSPTSPDETTTTPTASNLVFEGTLEQAQSRFYAFTASQGGGVTVNLASLNLLGHREVLTAPVRIGVGVPKGEGCGETESIETRAALVSQFFTTLGERHSLREYRRHGRSPRCGDSPDSLQPLLSADDEERCGRRGPARCPVERVVWWRCCHVSNRDNVAIDHHVDHTTGPERVGIAKPASGSAACRSAAKVTRLVGTTSH